MPVLYEMDILLTIWNGHLPSIKAIYETQCPYFKKSVRPCKVKTWWGDIAPILPSDSHRARTTYELQPQGVQGVHRQRDVAHPRPDGQSHAHIWPPLLGEVSHVTFKLIPVRLQLWTIFAIIHDTSYQLNSGSCGLLAHLVSFYLCSSVLITFL